MTDSNLQPVPGAFPAAAASFLLDGPAGKLEVACDQPRQAPRRQGTAVLCHPHPVHGGTMRNKVVTIAERALRESGLATVRFNFRGVGQSEGSFDNGDGEGDDLAAVVKWVRKVRPDDQLWLSGFSFGSYVALRNAARLGANALITVAPPVAGKYDVDAIELPTCPWLVVQGEEDEVVDPAGVFAWLESIDREPTVIRMPETSHFFHRRLMDLRGVIKNAIRNWLPPEIKA